MKILTFLNKKYLLAFLVFIVIFISSVAIWLILSLQYHPDNNDPSYYPSHDSEQNQPEIQISEIKTYRNEEWGFEFEYLGGWEVDCSTLIDKNHVLALVVASTSGSAGIDFFVNDWSKGNEVVLLLNEEVVSEININGIIGYEYERTSENKKKVAYLFPMGRYWMVISGEKNNREILQQIIVSLRFLSNRNIYYNEEWGFEFQYPCGWVISREHKSINYYSKLFLTIVSPKVVIRGDTGKKQLSLDRSFLTNIVLPEFVDTSFWRSQERVSSIIVGGVEGKKYEYEHQGFPQIAIILPFQDFRLILGTDDGSGQYLDEFNQIISSFKFLK